VFIREWMSSTGWPRYIWKSAVRRFVTFVCCCICVRKLPSLPQGAAVDVKQHFLSRALLTDDSHMPTCKLGLFLEHCRRFDRCPCRLHQSLISWEMNPDHRYFPSNRQHPSSDDSLQDKKQDYQNCSVLHRVPQLCPVVCTEQWLWCLFRT